MYLSRIPLDTKKRKTMLALASPSLFHGALESCFEGERQRRLWRTDNLNGRLYILVLSNSEPSFETFCEQFAENEKEWESRNYDEVIKNISGGDRLRFRITANPTKAQADEKGKRGRIKAHITIEHQRQWLKEQGEKNGFSVIDDEFDVVECKWKRFYKSGNKAVSFLAVSYEGILEIKDKELFVKALECGIGREKAYGMGLMTVIRNR